MAMATMLLALAAAATALPEDHPTCLAACATLSCARFAPATCALRDVGGAGLAAALVDRRLVLVGDSVARQVFIALGCLARDALTAVNVTWSTH